MAGAVKLADLLVLFWAARGIVHIAQVVFALDVVLVVTDELVLVRELEENCEETK